ncbi:DUF5330 domain-containing protein [Aureimonas sp. SK2]|uniref:DUF5330 domain-containing protein n=1 Tax=Aureimonas sp. SK2 TaxID=3015992 RepID=UPI00244407CF|nr:DUF5330 domain-containing protein [Aureimonas sp. SK2]
MRLLLKLAFLIGLALFFLAPRPGDEAGVPAGLSAGALAFAAQQAAADIGGFCDRAPMACESGRDAIRFAGARIVDGMTFVYGLAAGSVAAPATEPGPVLPAATAEVAQPASGGVPHERPHPAHGFAVPPPRPYVAPAG